MRYKFPDVKAVDLPGACETKFMQKIAMDALLAQESARERFINEAWDRLMNVASDVTEYNEIILSFSSHPLVTKSEVLALHILNTKKSDWQGCEDSYIVLQDLLLQASSKFLFTHAGYAVCCLNVWISTISVII